MIIALHTAPKGFFKTPLPYSNSELVRFVRKAASLGFKAVQIGPLKDYVSIDSERLKRVLDSLKLERSVHVGGTHDAKRFALTEEEYARVQEQIHYGIMLCSRISSKLMSFHPPFFAANRKANKEFLSKAKVRFLKLVMEEANFASRNQTKMALESFCYSPFIFEGLNDFAQFVSEFPAGKLGVLLDMGHLYQTGIDLYDAVCTFKHRLLDIHVHDATLEKDFQKATHLQIGKGAINFPEFVSILREVRYNEWLTLEIRGNEKEIMDSKDYLENLINTKP